MCVACNHYKVIEGKGVTIAFSYQPHGGLLHWIDRLRHCGSWFGSSYPSSVGVYDILYKRAEELKKRYQVNLRITRVWCGVVYEA